VRMQHAASSVSSTTEPIAGGRKASIKSAAFDATLAARTAARLSSHSTSSQEPRRRRDARLERCLARRRRTRLPFRQLILTVVFERMPANRRSGDDQNGFRGVVFWSQSDPNRKSTWRSALPVFEIMMMVVLAPASYRIQSLQRITSVKLPDIISDNILLGWRIGSKGCASSRRRNLQ
jgi:hypothetical protein